MGYIIIVFKNTHDAMAAEAAIKEKEIAIRIMPTPTSITQSCGICVRVESRELVEEILKIEFSYKNIYERNLSGYELIK